MASRTLPQSPLEQAGMESMPFESGSLRLAEIRSMSLVRLHSLLKSPCPGGGPYELPAVTGACSGGTPAVLCLRPGEWLLISEAQPAREILEGLEPFIDQEKTSAWDNSDGLAAFRLSGQGAPWLLSKLGCPDFLGGQSFGRHCTRTKIGHAAVIVHYHQAGGDSFLFDLIFDRSIARYLWLLLTESASHADELTTTHGNFV